MLKTRLLLISVFVLVIAGVIGAGLGFMHYNSDPLYRIAIDLEKNYKWIDVLNAELDENGTLHVAISANTDLLREEEESNPEAVMNALAQIRIVIARYMPEDTKNVVIYYCGDPDGDHRYTVGVVELLSVQLLRENPAMAFGLAKTIMSPLKPEKVKWEGNPYW